MLNSFSGKWKLENNWQKKNKHKTYFISKERNSRSKMMLISLLTSFVCNLSCLLCTTFKSILLSLFAFLRTEEKLLPWKVSLHLFRPKKRYPRETFYDSNFFCWEAGDDDNRQVFISFPHHPKYIRNLVKLVPIKKISFSWYSRIAPKSKNRFFIRDVIKHPLSFFSRSSFLSSVAKNHFILENFASHLKFD